MGSQLVGKVVVHVRDGEKPAQEATLAARVEVVKGLQRVGVEHGGSMVECMFVYGQTCVMPVCIVDIAEDDVEDLGRAGWHDGEKRRKVGMGKKRKKNRRSRQACTDRFPPRPPATCLLMRERMLAR